MAPRNVEPKRLVGYLTPFTAKPGDRVDVKVSSELSGRYSASLVRVVCGDDRPHGTGYQEAELPADFAGKYAARHQPICPGSFAALGDFPELDRFGFVCWVCPTLPDRRQTIFAGPNLQLGIDANYFRVTVGTTSVHTAIRAQKDRWHRVAVCFDRGAVQIRVLTRGLGSGEADAQVATEEGVVGAVSIRAGAWWLATTDGSMGGQFNGRLEAPRLSRDVDLERLQLALEVPLKLDGSLLAAWDFSKDMARDTCDDISGNGHVAKLAQQPTRAVRGVGWDGSQHCWRHAPEQYAAVHFHEDDLVDAGWSTDFSWTVPKDLSSGVYAVKVVQNGFEDLMPLFIKASPDAQKNPVAVLMSTATYLAYANQRLGFSDRIFSKSGPKNPSDAYLFEHPEVGSSLYEYHDDGSGVHFSSALRPVLNMKPKTIMWSFNADTNLLAWLTAIDQPFDVITDHDLHGDGAAALADYTTVVTGTHPEYHSTAMLDGLETWLANGGRLMYMGGNGFYWRIAFHPDNPNIIEVRRAEDGTRAWIAEPGEYYHQFTGEYGGLWRRLGRPPNQLVGIGFAAQGFDGGTYYRVNADALDPRAAWIVDGVEASDLIGNHGTQGGGAAGEEIDRYDLALGSPAHALVLATSEAHRPGMLRVKEEFHMTVPLGNDSKVRADMTFFETPSGGAVFSTGSISFAGSLSHDDYHNDIARVSGNVLKRFLDSTPFEYPTS